MSLYDSVAGQQMTSVLPGEKVYPGGFSAMGLVQAGSASPYGVPNTQGALTVPGPSTNDAQGALNYGSQTATQPPLDQPILWAFIFTMIGVVGLAWIAHIRVKA